MQCEVIITIKSVIELSTYLIDEKDYQYVLESRLTSNCVEKIFSCVRAKQPNPNALQFKFENYSISKYLKSVGNSSYEDDDRELLLVIFKPKAKKIKKKLPLVPDFSTKDINLGNIKMNALYDIAGYILSCILKYNITYESCLNSARSLTYQSQILPHLFN